MIRMGSSVNERERERDRVQSGGGDNGQQQKGPGTKYMAGLTDFGFSIWDLGGKLGPRQHPSVAGIRGWRPSSGAAVHVLLSFSCLQAVSVLLRL